MDEHLSDLNSALLPRSDVSSGTSDSRSELAVALDEPPIRIMALHALLYCERLFYLAQQPVSAQFYSGGKATKLADVSALAPYLEDAPRDFLAVRERDMARLPAPIQARLAPLGSFGEYRLFRELPRTSADGTAAPMR